MNPKYIEVTGIFTPRGGISIYPYANYGRPGTKVRADGGTSFDESGIYFTALIFFIQFFDVNIGDAGEVLLHFL